MGVALKHVDPCTRTITGVRWLCVVQARQKLMITYTHGRLHTHTRHTQVQKQARVCVRRPYLMDLESVNKTRLNGEVIPESRYVELKVCVCVFV